MDPEETIYFKIFGLQRSGTNLMRALISKNFQAEYLQEQETGWKHGPLRLARGMWKASPVRFVQCVKNPYAWAWSCYRFFQNSIGGDPTMAPQFQLNPSMPFEEFLLTSSYAFQSPIHRWNQMNRLWLATLPADRTLLVRQEDQVTDQMRILRAAEATLALRRQTEQLQSIEQRVDVDIKIRGDMNRDYYLDRQYMENYSPCLLEHVNRALDESLMQQFGYEFERWTIDQRQIGPLRLFVRPCTSDASDAFQMAADPHHICQIKRMGADIHTIVDLGAETGAWAAFVRNVWPQARLIVYEPDSDKLRLLKLNTRAMNHITIIGPQNEDASDPHRLPELLPLQIFKCVMSTTEASLVRIGSPQMAQCVLSQPELMHQVTKTAGWICARLPAELEDRSFLQVLSTAYDSQSWTTPAGGFILACRRHSCG